MQFNQSRPEKHHLVLTERRVDSRVEGSTFYRTVCNWDNADPDVIPINVATVDDADLSDALTILCAIERLNHGEAPKAILEDLFIGEARVGKPGNFEKVFFTRLPEWAQWQLFRVLFSLSAFIRMWRIATKEMKENA